MYKLVLNILALVTFTSALAQQRYKIFIDTTTGRMFYNKNLPVYFWVSTAPDNSGQDVLLQPKVKKYANPYYWDTEGINTFRIKYPRNKYGYKEAVFDIWADGLPPRLEINFDKAIWNSGKPVTGPWSSIKISAKDYFSGVDAIYYALDNNKFQKYTQPIKTQEQGNHKIYFYAIDRVGNVSDTIAKTFSVDMTAPQVNIEILNTKSDSILGPKSLIKISGSDPHGVKNYFYKFDHNANYNQYVGPISVKQLNEGHHIIYYYAVDKLGNQSTVFIKELTLDFTAPQIKTEFLGDYSKTKKLIFVSPNTKIKVSAQDKSPIEAIYYTENGRTTRTSSIIDLSQMRGYKQICIYAIDVAGNRSPSRCLNFFVDYRPPFTNLTIGQPKFFDRDTTFVSGKTKIYLNASDANSGVGKTEYAIDNMDFKIYTQPFTIANEGYHILYYKSIDKVGNIEKIRQKSLYVDNTPPEIKVVFSVEPFATDTINGKMISVYPDHLKVYLAAVDDKTGERRLYYRLNNGKKYLYQSPIILNVKAKKIFTLTIESSDALGNRSQEQITFEMRPK